MSYQTLTLKLNHYLKLMLDLFHAIFMIITSAFIVKDFG